MIQGQGSILSKLLHTWTVDSFVALISMHRNWNLIITKMIINCRKLSYTDRQKYFDLPTLKYRRLRDNMIEVFKTLSGFYDDDIVPSLLRIFDTRTRENSLKLLKCQIKYNLRKYSFWNRVVGGWNSLLNHVAIAESINAFKNVLDRLWCNQELYFNWDRNMII